jgi:hypothetical protein
LAFRFKSVKPFKLFLFGEEPWSHLRGQDHFFRRISATHTRQLVSHNI